MRVFQVLAGAVFAFLVLSTASATVYDFPGAIPGGFSVSNQGEGQYTIPVAIPVAAGGLSPSLALTYSHSAGNGLAGMRWSLSGFSAISRCRRTDAQDGVSDDVSYDSADRYCLDGQRLVDIGSSQFRTEIETFQRITSSGTAGSGPQSFKVEHGNGLHSMYGTTTDSRIEKVGASDVRIWYIAYTEDQFGNRIEYSYSENGTTGEAYPTGVAWTRNTGEGLTPQYSVTINYATRPSDDQRSGFDPGGAKWARTKRISSIVVKHGSTEINDYHLAYTSGTTGRSQLESVMLTRGNDYIPKTEFTWQDGTSSWNASTSTGEASDDYPLIGDFNGDGRQDVYHKVGTTFQVYFGRTDGDLESELNSGVTASSPSEARVMDYDGNGVDDLMYKNGGYWYAVTYNGSSFSSSSIGVLTSSVYTFTPLDFDGDGLNDLVYQSGTALKWRQNTGGAFGSEQTIVADMGTYVWRRNLSSPDTNGDGRAGMVGQYAYEYCAPPPYCQWISGTALNELAGGTYVNFWQVSEYDPSDGLIDLRRIDYNGDGLDDFIYPKGSYWWLVPNDGTTFDMSSEVSTGISNSGPIMIADYDSDGREDLLRGSSNTWYVHRSNGSNLATSATTSFTGHGAGDGGYIADITGDGLPDIVTEYSGVWHTSVHKGSWPDVITDFENGLGYGVAVTYEPLSNTAHYTLDASDVPSSDFEEQYAGPRYVVTDEVHDDGIGGTRPIEHHYDTGWISRSGRGWLSFDNHVVKDIDNGTYTYTEFNQAWPYIGRTEKSQLRRTSDGQVIRESDPEWTHYAWTASTPDRYFVYIDDVTSKDWEVGGAYNGTHLRTVVDDPTYSTTYGMLEERTVTVTQPGTSNSWTTVTDYDRSADTGANEWCLGLPGLVTTTVTVQPGSVSATRKLDHTFSATDCSLTQTIDESEASTDKRLKTSFTFDGFGNPNVVTLDSASGSATDRSVDYDYESTGQYVIKETIGTVGLYTQMTWDFVNAQPSTVTGTDGLTVTYTYDSFGRLESETGPGIDVDYVYDDCTSCFPGDAVYFVQVDRSDGSQDMQYFDALNRPVGAEWDLIGSERGRQQTEYNDVGRVLKSTQPYVSGESTYWETYAYDLVGRVTSVTGLKDTGTTTTSYAYLGHTTTVTDPRNNTTSTVRDAMGQIVQVTDDSSNSAAYTYAPFGELASMTDVESNTTTIDYDARGFKIEMTDPSYGDDWTYTYDVYGQLSQQTSPIDQGSGPTVSLTYDAAGRLYQRVEDEGTTTFTYYAYNAAAGSRGKLDEITAPGGYSERHAYGVTHGQTSWVRRTIDSVDYLFNMNYDSQGRLEELVYPQTTSGYRLRVDYAFDANGLLSTVKDGNVTYEYYALTETDAFGQEREVELNDGDMLESRTFYARTGRLNRIETDPTAGGTSVQDLTMTYDEVGNLKTRYDAIITETETLTYDGLNRLTSSQVTGESALSVNYSDAGRITSMNRTGCGSFSYGAGSAGPNAVTSACGNAYTYDDNGRMITRDGDDISWYSYDLPSEIESGSHYSQFWYGPSRERVKEVRYDGSSTTTIVKVGDLFEFLDDGTTETYRHYVHAGSRVVARLDRVGTTNTIEYLHRDHQGSVTKMTSTASGIVEELAIDPWGLRRNPSDWSELGSPFSGSYETDRGYTGHVHLDNVGLIHMNGRVQDPLIGRFISADPIIQAPYNTQSHNRYSYVWNNPATFVDPSGFQTECARAVDPETGSSTPVYCADLDGGGGNPDGGGGGIPIFDVGVGHVAPWAQPTDGPDVSSPIITNPMSSELSGRAQVWSPEMAGVQNAGQFMGQSAAGTRAGAGSTFAGRASIYRDLARQAESLGIDTVWYNAAADLNDLFASQDLRLRIFGSYGYLNDLGIELLGHNRTMFRSLANGEVTHRGLALDMHLVDFEQNLVEEITNRRFPSGPPGLLRAVVNTAFTDFFVPDELRGPMTSAEAVIGGPFNYWETEHRRQLGYAIMRSRREME